MNIINLRMHQVRKLKELELESGTFNTEALMLILNKKGSTTNNEGRMLFKYMDAQDDEKVMARKMYTINMLNSSEKYKNIKELLIPEYVVVVDSKIVGFALPLIENHKNLGNIINKDSNQLKEKTFYLTKIGEVIDKVIRIKGESFKMFFGDLNEYNFIVDQEGNVRAIDLDSAYLGQDEPIHMAYYLTRNKYLDQIEGKYQKTNTGIIIPNENSDLFCYNMMLLGTLAKEEIFDKDMATYYMYINHLKDIGIDKNLINCFNKLYIPSPNENPKDMIMSIKPSLEKEAEFKTFQKEYKYNWK